MTHWAEEKLARTTFWSRHKVGKRRMKAQHSPEQEVAITFSPWAAWTIGHPLFQQNRQDLDHAQTTVK